jgi:ABC-type transporter Mla subunit MlaD
MSARSSRNALAAGLLVTFGLVMIIGSVLILAGVTENLKYSSRYVVEFTIGDGAEGLEAGSIIKVGGRRVGRVAGLRFLPEDSPRKTAIAVDIVMTPEVTLYRNARPFLQLPLLGSSGSINIPNVGNPSLLTLSPGDDGVLRQGESLPGKLAPPSFLTQAGYEQEQADQLRLILRRGAEMADRLAKATEKVDPIMHNVEVFTDDAKAISGEVRAGVRRWTPNIDRSMVNIETATDEAAQRVREARSLVSGLQRLIDTNRPRIDSIFESARELADKMNKDLYDRVAASVKEAQGALAEFNEVGQRTNALMAELGPELRIMIANARLSSDQLLLTMTEVRRNPWRLLYTPSRREMEQELVFEAARAFAQSASDLRAASASVESVLAAMEAGQTPADAETLRAVQARLAEAFEKYAKSEKKFLDRVVQESK